jgi:hypothetical protein
MSLFTQQAVADTDETCAQRSLVGNLKIRDVYGNLTLRQVKVKGIAIPVTDREGP